MRTVLNQKQIKYFQKNGFLLIEDFLDEEELSFWRHAVMEAIEERNGQKMPGSDVKVGEDDGINEDSDYYAKVFDQMLNLSEDFDTFSRYLIADVRGYLPLHRHIVAAARFAGGHATGTEPEFFFLGGGFFLRGYWDLYSLYGTSYGLINAELRVQPFELLSMEPPRVFEKTGWPVQFVLFGDWASTLWRDSVIGPKGAGGMSLRLTLALPFVVEYAWYRKNMWDRSKGRDRGLLFTLMF